MSGSTTVGTVIWVIARSGSFNPWPVSTQTTVEPSGTPVASNPATEAAEAASQKTDSCWARNVYAPRISLSVTAVMEPRVLNEALAAGCAGFVTKGDSIDALAAAVRAAASGATPVSPAMLHRLVSSGARNSNLAQPLTSRETAVLLFLADGMGNEEIRTRLHISIHTLRNHIQSIIGKLGAHSKLEAVSIAIREGLITAPGSDY